MDVHGECDRAFERVREEFDHNFGRGDIGAAVAVTVDGQLVVDLWSGWMDAAKSRPWGRDTIVGCASTTKGLVGLCANVLVERGELDLDAPVSRYWPEFGTAGKEAMPVRYLLDHRAGLLMVEGQQRPEDLLDWDFVVTRLAAQAPMWEPGTTHGYHAVTYGYLVGEVVRRVTGRSIGTFLREEITTPLGVEFHIGTPADADDRCAEELPGPELAILSAMLPQDRTAYRRAEVPSGNGIGNARALATIYGVLATGGSKDDFRLISPETLAAANAEEVTGPWFGRPDGGFADTRFTAGFVLNSSTSYMGPAQNAFGYSGFGGSIGFADPANGMGFGYSPNAQLTLQAARDSRSGRLVDAVYECL